MHCQNSVRMMRLFVSQCRLYLVYFTWFTPTTQLQLFFSYNFNFFICNTGTGNVPASQYYGPRGRLLTSEKSVTRDKLKCGWSVEWNQRVIKLIWCDWCYICTQNIYCLGKKNSLKKTCRTLSAYATYFNPAPTHCGMTYGAELWCRINFGAWQAATESALDGVAADLHRLHCHIYDASSPDAPLLCGTEDWMQLCWMI